VTALKPRSSARHRRLAAVSSHCSAEIGRTRDVTLVVNSRGCSRQRTPPATAAKATVLPTNVPWERRSAVAAHRADAGPQSDPLAAGHRVASRRAVQTVSVIMPTVSWSGTFATCVPRVLEMIDAASCAVEFIVAYDGTVVDRPERLEWPDVRAVATGRVVGATLVQHPPRGFRLATRCPTATLTQADLTQADPGQRKSWETDRFSEAGISMPPVRERGLSLLRGAGSPYGPCPPSAAPADS